jgi:hypothetical protein
MDYYKKYIKYKNKYNFIKQNSLQIGGDSKLVHILYVKGRIVSDPNKYEIICVSDTMDDLINLAKDVPENMIAPFKDKVLEHMFSQKLYTDVKPEKYDVLKLDVNTTNEKDDKTSSNDESTLYYTYNNVGLVELIYNDREKLKLEATNSDDIKEIKKNNIDWEIPVFTDKI